ncbi:MAG: DUF6110 family protein [Lachnospirales bacterium]
MYEWIKNEKTIAFAGGVAAGVVALATLKAKKTRELAVKGLAKGIIIKDSVVEEISNIREEADDICAEAREEAQKHCENVEELEEVEV